ncbi:MAG: penicillin-binding transpeptidase domain-containing protein, partial [Desulfobacteraceae bacterium]|nr:penicillin-binding transpeptidase domain-containing protein [Desulfobacteraceae bacterium]
PEILEIYLNELYLGQKGSVSINCIDEAAEFYFGKQVEALTVSESAVLAGIIKGPNIYSPYADMEKCRKRRDEVLTAMHNKQLLSDDEFIQAIKEPIKTIGYKKHDREAPYFMDYVSMQLNALYPETTLSSMGFSIYTTLDTDVQQAAENALEKGLRDLEEKNPDLVKKEPGQKLQGAIVVMQPRTGNIIAMVGGRDYKESQFNRITQAKRQPGSCFKPIMAASFLDVFKPSDFLSNEEKHYPVNGSLWTPENFDAIPQKKVTVRDMLSLSCNRAAVDMAVRGGLAHVVETAKAFNFSTVFKPYPSIALGAFEVFPLEIARAYCVFAADGIQPFPLSLKDVADENGTLLVRQTMNIHTVLTPAQAFLITSMLESVVSNGTAKSLKNLGVNFCLAGKTGTSSDYKDAWFIGYTPDFLALVWVGFDNGQSIHSTGAGAAIPIFADLVKHMPGYVTQNTFPVPPGVVTKRICSESGKLALPACPVTYDEYYLEENKPELPCDIHTSPTVFRKFFDDVKHLFQ